MYWQNLTIAHKQPVFWQGANYLFLTFSVGSGFCFNHISTAVLISWMLQHVYSCKSTNHVNTSLRESGYHVPLWTCNIQNRIVSSLGKAKKRWEVHRRHCPYYMRWLLLEWPWGDIQNRPRRKHGNGFHQTRWKKSNAPSILRQDLGILKHSPPKIC